MAIGVVFLLEFVASSVIAMQFFAFIPIYDGIVFMLMNMQPILHNVHIFGWQPFEPVLSGAFSLNSTNTTEVINATEILNSTKL